MRNDLMATLPSKHGSDFTEMPRPLMLILQWSAISTH